MTQHSDQDRPADENKPNQADSGAANEIDKICDEFEQRCKSGTLQPIETYLNQVPSSQQSDLLRELLLLEWDLLKRRRSDPNPDNYVARFPDHHQLVRSAWSEFAKYDTADRGEQSRNFRSRGVRMRCPHCRNPIEIVTDEEFEEVECPSCHSSFNLVGYETAKVEPLSRTLGHFVLERCVGRGAFGSVWKAHDSELDRVVAIKIPRIGQIERDEAGNFIREARAAAQLHHPNIVSVHEIGREKECLYIVSDFVDGVNLQSWLEAGRPTIREALDVLTKVAEALHHAHQKGVVHRDLKPSNIMLGDDGQPQVMDFGLAKREAAEITVTVDGAQLGTPAYMPPEQIRSANQADARSDVYSLGVTMYQLMTGELPFRGDQAMLLYQVLNREPPSPRQLVSDLPKDLETICMRCLHKSPDRRFPTAQEFADDVQRFLAGQPIKSKPPSRLEQVFKWYSKHADQFAGAWWMIAPTVGILWHSVHILTTSDASFAELANLFNCFMIIAFGYMVLSFNSRTWLWVGLLYVPLNFLYFFPLLNDKYDVSVVIANHAVAGIGTLLFCVALGLHYFGREQRLD